MPKLMYKFNPCPKCGGFKSVTVDKDTGMFKEWCLNTHCDYELLRPDIRNNINKVDFPDRRNILNGNNV